MNVWIVIAEYTSHADKDGCGSPDISPYVVGVFEDAEDAAAAAEKERQGGDLGNFHGGHEWSDCGWWVGVYPSEVTLSKKKASTAWGIPRRSNDGTNIDVSVRHVDMYGRASDPEHKYVLVAEDVYGVMGHMDVTVYRDIAHVDWIEVDPGQRRRGVATALYRKLYTWASSEGISVQHGMTTEQGAAALEAIQPEIAQLKASLLEDPRR